MADYPDAFVSPLLSDDQLRSAIEAVPNAFLSLLGNSRIKASYGFGCNLHFDLLYTRMEVGTQWLERFVSDSLRQQIVVPGESDFYFFIPDDRLVLVFCHEGHIHMEGSDAELQGKLLENEPFNQLRPGASHSKPDA